MNKSDIIRKLTSRKLWVSIASFVSLLMVARGFSESAAAQVTAIIMAGASVLGYLFAEGLTDAANAGGASTENPMEVLVKPVVEKLERK